VGPVRFSNILRLPISDPVDLTLIHPRSTPGFAGPKAAGLRAQAELAPRLAALQEMLFAEGRAGGSRAVLLVLQGMDTAGKGGTVKHVLGQVDPMGVRYKAFKAPTDEERRHPFLWRIRKELPDAGIIGVFDRSHYEDLLVPRVHHLVQPRTIRNRYASINRFEEELVARGTAVVKCFLHLSYDEQGRRLLARLTDATKNWKYNPSDIDERERWFDYQEAYAAALGRTNTETAPWHVVPADRKWWRNLAVTHLLVETLESMSPAYPAPTYDVQHEIRRLLG
jgi:PPK2 family polyphosphate:nucleotide phosphotransferase